METKKRSSLFIKEDLIDMIFYGRIINKKSYPPKRAKIDYVLPFPVKRVFVNDVTKRERVYVKFEVKGQITQIELKFSTPLELNESRDLKFTAQAYKKSLLKHENGVQGYHWPKLLNTLHVENEHLFSLSHLIFRSERQNHTSNVIVDSTIPYLVSWRPWRKGLSFEIGNNVSYDIHVSIPLRVMEEELQEVQLKTFAFNDSPYQKVDLINTNLPARSIIDEDENAFISWKIPVLPVGDHEFTMHFSIKRKPNFMESMPHATIEDLPSVPKEWISETSIWNRNKRTTSLVNKGLETSNNVFRIISYLNYELNKILTFKKSMNRLPATMVLRNGEANSMQYNDVFVSILRQMTIPTRLALGFMFNPFTKQLEPHSWPEIYLPNKKWFAFDPSFGYMNGLPSQHILQVYETTQHHPRQYWLTYLNEKEQANQVKVSLYYKLTP